jgi:hypothetical protein
MEFTKFMKRMVELMEAKGLSDKTIQYYLDRAYRLNNKKKFTSIKFLRDTNIIIPLLKENLSTATQKSYSGTLITLLDLYPNKLNKKAIDIYKNFISKEDMDQYIQEQDKKTEKQADNWLNLDELLQIKNKLNEQIQQINFEKKLNQKEYLTILKNFILSLYLNLAPRRSSDYTLMKIGPDEDESYNYLNLDKKELIFNQYKTKKTYGKQIIDISNNKELLEDLNLYLKYRKSDNDFLLIKSNGKPFNQTNDMTKTLNQIFGKKISTQMLRNIYLTSKYGSVKNDLKQDTTEMGTSMKCALNIYSKDSR